MRRGRIGAALTAVFAAGLLAAASGAAAATPLDICKDLADGKLDGTYTQAELQAYANALQTDPTMQGYCSPLYVVTVPSSTPAAPGKSGSAPAARPSAPRTTGVAGAQKTKQQPKQVLAVTPPSRTAAPLATTHTTGTLPFTGAQLAVFAIVGGALLAGGFLLRLTGRQKRSRL